VENNLNIFAKRVDSNSVFKLNRAFKNFNLKKKFNQKRGNMKYLTNKLVCVGMVMSLGFTARAATIFDNTTAYNSHQFTLGNGQQIGNEVTLGSGWVLTNFQFEYYSPDSGPLNSSLGVDVRFYLNNGPLDPAGYPTPSTLIFDSGWFSNGNVGAGNIPTGANDLNYNSSDLSTLVTGLPGNVLPGDFTYSITFTNLGSNTIELPLANSTAGTNYGTYWLYNNVSSQWALLTNNATPANDLVIFQGTPTPEPSVIGLGAIGSLLLVGVSKLKRKR
jgi:hypothetical protein